MVTIYPKPRYPHMLPNEVELWDRFLKVTDIEFIRFEYDVHVGEIIEAPPGTPDYLKPMLEAVYRKRIDAVGHTADAIWVFEVKNRAGLSAMGQALAYKELYIVEFRPVLPIRMGVVCEMKATDVDYLYRLHNIHLFVV